MLQIFYQSISPFVENFDEFFQNVEVEGRGDYPSMEVPMFACWSDQAISEPWFQEVVSRGFCYVDCIFQKNLKINIIIFIICIF